VVPARVTLTAMKRAKDAVGAYGERVAAAHLTAQGMVVLDRNWRGLSGEVDIIAREGSAVIFCEVKTRRSARFGAPVEAIGPAKVGRLRRLAAQWLADTGVRPTRVRFDVISVHPQPSGAAHIDHLRDAF
jgi:putative endonuclease